jgi:hypothetical protein
MRMRQAIFVPCDSIGAGDAVSNKLSCYGEKTKREEDLYS